MKILILVSLWILHTEVWSKETRISSFETDFCTNYPEGTQEKPELWKHCCLMHDMFFWAGGNKADRLDADLKLKNCIADTGSLYQARIMYLAVRAGSYSPIKYPKMKWNNGWDKRPDFQSLSSRDIDNVEEEIFSSYDYIPLELKQTFIYQLRRRLE